MEKVYVIIDPQHEYAVELMRIAKEAHGLRPICVYIDSRAELYKRAHFPKLRSKAVAAHFYLDQMPVEQMAKQMKARFEVVGMMPYFEQSLHPARELMMALGWKWNDPAVIARFRDKSGLKEHLRQNHPHIPLGASWMVQSAQDVFVEKLPERFVIKPNDGFANRDVGFFRKADGRAPVEAYLRDQTVSAYILEEMLDGTEFAINGQMDEQGRASVVSVLEYERVPANGKPNVYHHTVHVPRTDPRFGNMVDYACAVMNASGLRRAPFHLELMLTDQGPRLIEVGARFGGTRYVFMTNAVHDNAFNHFAMAAHYWLFDKPYRGQGPKWDFYDRVSYLHLDGIAPKNERIYSLGGMAEIEGLKEFDGWVVKPHVGGFIRRTVDLYSVPYSLHLKGFEGRASLSAVSGRVEKMLRINANVSPAQRMWVDAKASAEQVRMRAQWLLTRLLKRG